jgi:hypothetical protein
MPSCLLLIAALVAAQVAESSPAEPVVAVWYRGTPAGTPRQDDLAAIRAQGFTGVTWPAGQTSRLDELRRIAGSLGLAVTVQAAPVPLTAASALRPTDRVDVDVTRLAADEIPALVWRAVGHGARTIAFDSGAQAGAPLTDAGGRPLPWVGPASAIARQLTFNARLFLDARAGPRIAIQPPAAGRRHRAAGNRARLDADCDEHIGRAGDDGRRAAGGGAARALDEPARRIRSLDAEPPVRSALDVRARGRRGRTLGHR